MQTLFLNSWDAFLIEFHHTYSYMFTAGSKINMLTIYRYPAYIANMFCIKSDSEMVVHFEK